MADADGATLIGELLDAPAAFVEKGRAYDLLQAYFAGFPKETLRPLLQADDTSVQRSAAFVVSELGGSAASLVNELPRLTKSSDVHVVWYAMESLAVCARGDQARLFEPVVLMLEVENDSLRRLAMRLMSRVDLEQLAVVHNDFALRGGNFEAHVRGLQALTNPHLGKSATVSMLADGNPLIRRYGAIAAKRHRMKYSDLLLGAQLPVDDDVCALIS